MAGAAGGYLWLQPLQSRLLIFSGAIVPAVCCPTTMVRVAEAEPDSDSWAATATTATGMAAFHTHPRALVKRLCTSVSSRFWPASEHQTFPRSWRGGRIPIFENAPAGNVTSR